MMIIQSRIIRCVATIALGVLFLCQSRSDAYAYSVMVVDSLPSGELVPEALDNKLSNIIEGRYKTYFDSSIPSRIRTKNLSSEEYQKRLRALNSIIPLTYNSIVHECIDQFLNKRTRLLEKMITESAYYFPIIEAELDREELPLELKYLTIVESALSPTAVSSRGATGIWQLMLATAKAYGLRIDSLVDERRDPKKSTTAVCALLKDMYNLYGDWLLALAAYNCGPGNVNKAIRKSGGVKDYWKIYPHLPRETRSYVPYFIAVYYSMEYYQDYDISPVNTTKIPLAIDTIRLNKRYSFKQISTISGADVDTIMLLNPQYRKGIVPGHGEDHVVVLPLSNAAKFAEKAQDKTVVEDDTTQQREPILKEKTLYHKVRKNETIARIAKEYGVTIEEIKRWNKLGKNRLKRGQRLVIKTTEEDESPKIDTPQKLTPPTSQEKESKTKSSKTPAAKRYHTVRKGETLSSIAAKYKGVTVNKIKKANGLKNNNIRSGQKLIIP